MTARSAADLCRRLEVLGMPIRLDGGWGADALLGEETRRLDDLDIAIEERHVAALHVLLAADGYKDVPRDDTSARNFVLRDTEGQLIDVHAIAFDPAGNGTMDRGKRASTILRTPSPDAVVSPACRCAASPCSTRSPAAATRSATRTFPTSTRSVDALG